MQRELIEKHWHRAHLIAWYLQAVPFIRFIAVTGSLAYDIVKAHSDIDIFIVAKEGRIWTARACTLWFLKIIRQLRTAKRRSGMICPNRFASDGQLIIHPQNRYHAQDYTQMVPLFDYGEVYDQFMAKNQWMTKFGFFKPRRSTALVNSRTLAFIRRSVEWFLGGLAGDILEERLKIGQLRRIKLEYPDLNEANSSIAADDQEIRIHPQPR